ncbi:MAG: cyclic beta 1-2 glucan synthetase [Deltaproteobacteria bacterium]|nr:cyclic beta 1-2 glucan synthetase [Deltaproteobacteria bacterium]
MKARFGGVAGPLAYAEDEPPLRSELFSSDQMKRHGRVLAESHKLSPGRPSNRLLTRLAENETVLIEAHKLLTEAVKADRRIVPAGEWLLDNFYLIEEQIRMAQRHLPKRYSRELPHLLNGPSGGLPRVYDIALEIVSHGDGCADAESLSNFVEAYQTVTDLKLGELWSIPIMLRLALIENLRRIVARIAGGRMDRNRADYWADQMVKSVETDPNGLILVIADMARSNPALVSSFVAEFARRLQGQGPALALPLTWIEQRLSESGLTIERLMQKESRQQAADQVSLSNSIGSLRFLGAMDWREFVETMSAVNRILREDPSEVYGKMDFATRDRYRHMVEYIAKRSPLSESEVARRAIRLAGEGVDGKDGGNPSAHVGFYLIDKGLRDLESVADIRLSTLEAIHRKICKAPLLLYLGANFLITVILTGLFLEKANLGEMPVWLMALIVASLLLGASHLAVALTNWLATLLAVPRLLPRMNFSEGIPPEFRTLAVIPTMLTSAHNVENLVEALEVRFLSNRDDNLHFGLLTDFRDASEKTLPEDEPLLSLAQKGIRGLNEKYRNAKSDIFFLFHRPRRWNPHEKIWMGYERKRGKLEDLNLLLRGGKEDYFFLIVGDMGVLTNVKYVITLDTDTALPRDSACQFVGAMAHPLNRVRYGKNKERAVAGYTILQPRVAVSLPGVNQSRYVQLFGNEPGIDPYTRVVSDVYQDVFGEGSFIGKGIYDVDAFERSLKGRFPENRILSHDLLEGCYARAGLLSDVLLYEEYPSRYAAEVSRRHRWIRGDWQIARWLFPGVPDLAKNRRKNPLSGVSRWKIFDNLRRSLVPAALTLLLLLGWTTLSPPWLWTVLAMGILLIPSWIASLLDLCKKPREVLLRQHLAASVRSAARHSAQAAFTFACLPYEAFFSLDAIVRTAWRMRISHKQLLEWNPSVDADHQGRTDLTASWRAMWFAPFLAAAAGIYLAVSNPATLIPAGPVLSLWFISPAIAWWISRPLARRKTTLTADQTLFLRKLSRKTWRFFETFVGPEDHWLPPDNYQEQPVSVVAHRTSPTNMGFALLANLCAYDFGYISAGELIKRTRNAFHTMKKLERYKGHFYNWYDTLTLKPLQPTYISTVDSGNLAGYLLTLRPALLALPGERILEAQWFEGLGDTLSILMDAMGDPASPSLGQLQKDLASLSASWPTKLRETRFHLAGMAASAEGLVRSLGTDPASQVGHWARALLRQCREALNELAFLTPWAVLPDPPDKESIPGWLDAFPTLNELAGFTGKWLQAVEDRVGPETSLEEKNRLSEFRSLIIQASGRARARIATIERLARRSVEMADMEYDFLFDKARHLLTIGYNVLERRRDSSYYDLLASEARFATFVGISQGKLPQESWFSLGRLLTSAGGKPILLSWSGSMFEYLMPLLVMPTYEGTLLEQTYQAAVERQIQYGRSRGMPWGISESGYLAIDIHRNYQYRAFGVPGLGLKRGLSEDSVIAPYASALALMVRPEAACMNLQRLAAEGLAGKYGLYEAIDYTPSRLPHGQSSAVVRSFMAHHQGMSLLALAYLLLGRPMQKRFDSDPLFRATTLLLQERIPKATAFHWHTAELSEVHAAAGDSETPALVFHSADTRVPKVQILSNGRYHVMVSNAGGGYSRWNDMAVTRWREDSTRDNWGSFCYLRDVASGEFWSTAYQPALRPSESYEAIFSESKAEFRCRHSDLDAHTEIVVSPEDDIEVRRLVIGNHSRARRTVEITSYAEVVLASPASDALHPAFSNLFVQTEILSAKQAILCARRPRSPDEPTPWMFHLMAVRETNIEDISYETDRSRFIGRGNTPADPQAMNETTMLSGSEGSVLDPIVSIRCRIHLEPGESATINMVFGMSETRDACVGQVEKYRDWHFTDRVFDLAWTHSQVFLRHINATWADAQLYGRLAGSIIYADSSLRAAPKVLVKNRRGQSGLWSHAISGDFPIVLLRIGDRANIDLVRQLVQAHAYWRLKGLTVDLVIWNEDHSGYRQGLHEQIMVLIAAGIEANMTDRPGGIFVRPADQMSDEDRILIQTVARVILSDDRGALADQITRRGLPVTAVSSLTPRQTRRTASSEVGALPRSDLVFFNGLGGFTPDGREYVVTTGLGQTTPAPWANVLANPTFGSLISESGPVCTWSENAHEFRLTPWTNDPVSDSSGEAFYLRDEERGHFWSPTPLPSRGDTPYATRHGFGYSVFEHNERGILSELWVYVAVDASIKFTVLKVRNKCGRSRRLSATGYVEWVLGDLRPKSAMHVITEINPETGAIFARNHYGAEFADRVAFFHVDDTSRTVSGDRAEFIGRNGTLQSPAAMTRSGLSGKVGAALDPCAGIHVQFEIGDGQERELVFLLGIGKDAGDAVNMVRRVRGSAGAQEALEAVWGYWNRTLGAVQVETPDTALNVLANGWLPYQTMTSRLWGRCGIYQSGGAFGFRDQLQDVMALVYAEPGLFREHLLRSAAHQFPEGDVQHWWHPPSDRGVRTRCSDDYLWLPLATCRYISNTGDTGVLDESVPSLEGRLLKEDEESYYDQPNRSGELISLYEHCVRAILRSLRFGAHGLPLMGSGDWNDGMNRVGIEGKGESVWLGFFLYEVLIQFREVARRRQETAFAERCMKEAERLRRNLEGNGWDGAWYRRAYFDDGSPLGSSVNTECRIDSIAQSWSVLSGAADPERSRMAMEAVDEHLVRREHGLVQLLDPPFDQSDLDPGYIKGYVPGVRENGGQYTHAAIWAAMAFARLGDRRRAWELFTMINPVNHGRSPEETSTYKVEPYVIAADVYAVAPHTGRGGWTWYTGSAAWMYRLVVESLLGLKLEVDKLRFEPCLPADWNGFKVHYRYRETVYHIEVLQTDDENTDVRVTVDGTEGRDKTIPLKDDHLEHTVEVRIPGSREALPIINTQLGRHAMVAS